MKVTILRKMSKRTYISKEEKKMPRFKAAKGRLRLLLWGKADESQKFKPYLVYNSENPLAF
jgi:hypothetical protein